MSTAPSGGVLFHFKYSQSARLDRIDNVKVPRPVGLHEMRDEGAALYLLPRLIAQGLTDVEPCINNDEAMDLQESGARQRFSARDLILVTTRPPLDDHKESSKRHLRRTESWLENRIFDHVKRHVSYCSRSRVDLTAEAAARLSPENERRASVEFRISDEALYKRCGRSATELHRFKSEVHPTTAGYLVETDPLWEAGPRGLLIWAMSGPVTIAYSYALSRRLPELLTLRGRARFAMIEISVEQGTLLPQQVPTDYAFTKSWSLRPLID